MSRFLVTGVNGFVGEHLTNELHSQGHEVVGIGHHEPANPRVEEMLTDYWVCDLADEKEVGKLKLNDIDAVISLAGLAKVGESFDKPELYKKVNVGVLENLCRQILAEGDTSTRVIAVSSGAVYSSDQEMPLKETSQTTRESSPYAASKIAMEDVARDLREDGLDCVIARPFNHIGPGQAPGFLLPDLLEKIKNIGDEDEIKVGNLKTKRDFTDVRDVARAYIALATQESLQHDTYNVCSGTPTAGEDILEMLKKACNKTDLETVVDESLFRPSDAPILYGDNSRIKEETSWEPTIPLAQTIEDFVFENK